MMHTRRFAIYTRKSSEEGLEQDFNSLHAQREACEAYVASQRHEGWQLVATPYDDGGRSGGTMDRPALTRLLADIDGGLVNGVVVYKVDRLTRSLTDFAKIVDRFDARQVSFVSVTQSFNTTTSMGRLTLNMLLSFAQFEREVTGERIRDKIRKSKAKGLWMGGWVPFGYEADGRTLRVRAEEAATVRSIFERYLTLGTIPLLKADCDRRGLTTPPRRSAAGRAYGGCALSRGYLHKLLSNPLYTGRIRHGDEVHEGRHDAIVPDELFDAVQQQLARRGGQGMASTTSGSGRSGEQRTPGRAAPLPLLGRICDAEGAPVTATHTKKGPRRHDYYVGGDLRLPARRIERELAAAARAALADPKRVTDAVMQRDGSLDGLQTTLTRASALAADADDRTLLDHLVRAQIGSDEVGLSIALQDDGRDRGADGHGAPQAHDAGVHHDDASALTFRAPVALRKRGVEWRMVIGAAGKAEGVPDRDDTLVRTIARAFAWQDELIATPGLKVKTIAERERVGERYVAKHLPLAGLSPIIVRAILAGTQPVTLTADRLLKLPSLPLAWSEQAAMLGFDR